MKREREVRDGPRHGSAARGMLWLLAQMACGRAALFLSQIILARLLSPEDFGSVGLTYTITAIIASFTASGIGDVLLQRSRTFHLWAWPAFWIDVILASIGVALVLFLAPLGARLYGAPEITGLASVLAVAMPLAALSTVPLTAIRLLLNFRLLAMIGTAEILAAQSLSILLAWYGMGSYSFVVPVPIVAAFKTVWLWTTVRPCMHRPQPRRAWVYLIKSGLLVWSVRLVNALIGQGDYFMLGLFASREDVGLYFFAFRLSAQPLLALANNFRSVLYPILAQLRSQPREQYQRAIRASQTLAAMIFFVACLQAALAAPLLHLLFHHRWNGSICLVQILSLALSFDAVPWVAGALLDARREFWKTLICALVAFPWFFILVGLGAWLGRARGVAVAVGLYYAVFGPCYSFVAMRGGGANLLSILRIYGAPLILACSAVTAAYSVAYLLHENIVQAVSLVAMATAFYAGLLRVCMPQTFSAIVAQANSVISRPR